MISCLTLVNTMLRVKISIFIKEKCMNHIHRKGVTYSLCCRTNLITRRLRQPTHSPISCNRVWKSVFLWSSSHSLTTIRILLMIILMIWRKKWVSYTVIFKNLLRTRWRDALPYENKWALSSILRLRWSPSTGFN